jgi:hypothetical protein
VGPRLQRESQLKPEGVAEMGICKLTLSANAANENLEKVLSKNEEENVLITTELTGATDEVGGCGCPGMKSNKENKYKLTLKGKALQLGPVLFRSEPAENFEVGSSLALVTRFTFTGGTVACEEQ